MTKKKTLLKEGTVRQFMKLANLKPLASEFVNKLYESEEVQEESEEVQEEGDTSIDAGAKQLAEDDAADDDFGGNLGDESETDPGHTDYEGEPIDDEGAGGDVDVHSLVRAIAGAIESETGVSVDVAEEEEEADLEDLEGEDELEDTAMLDDEEVDLGDDEEELGELEEVISTIAENVTQRLQKMTSEAKKKRKSNQSLQEVEVSRIMGYDDPDVMGLDPGEADDDEQAYFRGKGIASLASQSGEQADIYKDEEFLKKMRVIQLMRQGNGMAKAKALARAEKEDLATLQQAYAGYKRKQAKGPGPDPKPVKNCDWYRRALTTMVECGVCNIGNHADLSCAGDYREIKGIVDATLIGMNLKAGRDFRSYPQMIRKIREKCVDAQCPDPGPDPGPEPDPKKRRKARTRMGSDPGSKGGMRMGDITAPDIRDNADEEDFNAFSDLGKFFKDAQKRGSLFEDMTSDQQKALVKLVAERLKKKQLSEISFTDQPTQSLQAVSNAMHRIGQRKKYKNLHGPFIPPGIYPEDWPFSKKDKKRARTLKKRARTLKAYGQMAAMLSQRGYEIPGNPEQRRLAINKMWDKLGVKATSYGQMMRLLKQRYKVRGDETRKNYFGARAPQKTSPTQNKALGTVGVREAKKGGE